MSRARRWPLHPRPGPLESMSSWLGRLATLHGLPVKDLVTHNLDLIDVTVRLWDLDGDLPAPMLAALAERTGVEVAQLTMMTLAAWEPWLFDTRHVREWDNDQALFDTYVRENSVCSRRARLASIRCPASSPGRGRGCPSRRVGCAGRARSAPPTPTVARP